MEKLRPRVVNGFRGAFFCLQLNFFLVLSRVYDFDKFLVGENVFGTTGIGPSSGAELSELIFFLLFILYFFPPPFCYFQRWLFNNLMSARKPDHVTHHAHDWSLPAVASVRPPPLVSGCGRPHFPPSSIYTSGRAPRPLDTLFCHFALSGRKSYLLDKGSWKEVFILCFTQR